jgi:tetratricopeptide (TPR) repeat protein
MAADWVRALKGGTMRLAPVALLLAFPLPACPQTPDDTKLSEYLRLQMWDEALPILQAQVKHDEFNAGARSLLGFALSRTGAYKDALKQFKLAARIDPSLWASSVGSIETYRALYTQGKNPEFRIGLCSAYGDILKASIPAAAPVPELFAMLVPFKSFGMASEDAKRSLRDLKSNLAGRWKNEKSGEDARIDAIDEGAIGKPAGGWHIYHSRDAAWNVYSFHTAGNSQDGSGYYGDGSCIYELTVSLKATACATSLLIEGSFTGRGASGEGTVQSKACRTIAHDFGTKGPKGPAVEFRLSRID